MGIREDIYQYLADYRGVLGWNQYQDPFTGKGVPAIEIPLYIKDAQVPTRKVKMTEVSTIQTIDPGTQMDTTTQVIFYGPPDVLQQQITGWTITPVVNGVWAPVDKFGNPLNWGQLSYNDIIGYFIEGKMFRNLAGTWQRRDPDYYTTPRGQQYTNPVIATFSPSAAAVQKKQPFDMLLYLET
jgi:hypothetical protein